MSSYAARIKQLAPDYDPRHVEAYMRLEHPTLDALPDWQSVREVSLCCRCIEHSGNLYARFVRSMGMDTERTPDGIAWLGSRLDYRALNDMMREFR